MEDRIKSYILSKTQAQEIDEVHIIQSLWSGYGQLLKVKLNGGRYPSVIVKHVQLYHQVNHPRGWNTDIGHLRKVKSYEVESNWYMTYSESCRARLPECIAVHQGVNEVIIILEDLDAAGYPVRLHRVSWPEIEACLEWLAYFHASFIGVDPIGLWYEGTYWHLDTRPDELEALTDQRLKNSAPAIADVLATCKYRTIIHGDAKLANFCFSKEGAVAGVDYQYVGGGCGMKDVAYFIGSCLNEEDCEAKEDQILDTYFSYLRTACNQTIGEIEQEWRPLYRVAWADFHRFIKGWSPGHWKINSYSERITDEVIKHLS